MPEINRENPSLESLREAETLPTQDLSGAKEALPDLSRNIEISQENLQERQPQTQQQIQTTSTTPQKLKSIVSNKEVQAMKEMDEKRKVETLTMVAFEKGISHSIELAKKLKDPYILDALHDKLVGELREELIKRGKLKNL